LKTDFIKNGIRTVLFSDHADDGFVRLLAVSPLKSVDVVIAFAAACAREISRIISLSYSPDLKIFSADFSHQQTPFVLFQG
ncbi:MAG: hypothetical protein ACYTET_02840, partial [Planctomycetota bacterium]